MKNKLTFGRLLLVLLTAQTLLFLFVFNKQKSKLAQSTVPRAHKVLSCQEISRQLNDSPRQLLNVQKCESSNCSESSYIRSQSESQSQTNAPSDKWVILAIDGAGTKAIRHGAVPEIKVNVPKSNDPVSYFISNKKSVVWNFENPSGRKINRVVLASDSPSWVVGLDNGFKFEWVGTKHICRQAWAHEDEYNEDREFDFMLEGFRAYTGSVESEFQGQRYANEFTAPIIDNSIYNKTSGSRKVSSLEAKSDPLQVAEANSTTSYLVNGRASLEKKRSVQFASDFKYEGEEFHFEIDGPNFTLQSKNNSSKNETFIKTALAELIHVDHLNMYEDKLLAANRDGIHIFDKGSHTFHLVWPWVAQQLRILNLNRNDVEGDKSITLEAITTSPHHVFRQTVSWKNLNEAFENRNVINREEYNAEEMVTQPAFGTIPETWIFAKNMNSEGRDKKGLRIFKPQNLKGEFVLLGGSTDLSDSSAPK